MSKITAILMSSDVENTTATQTPTNLSSTYVLPFDESWIIASTTIITIFFVVGLTANFTALAVIYKSPRLKNQYYLCLASLSVSDIISALTSVLFLYKQLWGFRYFQWALFFCQLFWGLYFWTAFSTVLHIVSFALLRLIGVCWPIKYQNITRKHIEIWLAGIWVFTFISGFIPHFIFNTVRDIDREGNEARWESCSLNPDLITAWRYYAEVVYDFIFSISALAIIGISIAIAYVLKKRSLPPGYVSNQTPSKESESHYISSVGGNCNVSRNANFNNSNQQETNPSKKQTTGYNREKAMQRRKKKDKQIILQLLLISCSFLIGYVPLTVYSFYAGFKSDHSSPYINSLEWKFGTIQYILLRFSECLNPVFYNLSSKKMQRETKKLLKGACQRLPACFKPRIKSEKSRQVSCTPEASRPSPK